MKKIVFTLLAVVLLVTVFTAGLPAVSADTVTVNVFNWGEYISDGGEGSMDVNKEFEKRTGIKVNYSNYETNESMYAKLKNGGANYHSV